MPFPTLLFPGWNRTVAHVKQKLQVRFSVRVFLAMATIGKQSFYRKELETFNENLVVHYTTKGWFTKPYESYVKVLRVYIVASDYRPEEVRTTA